MIGFLSISTRNFVLQWFSKFRVHQNCLEILFKHRFINPTFRDSDSVGLIWGCQICFFFFSFMLTACRSSWARAQTVPQQQPEPQQCGILNRQATRKLPNLHFSQTSRWGLCVVYTLSTLHIQRKCCCTRSPYRAALNLVVCAMVIKATAHLVDSDLEEVDPR